MEEQEQVQGPMTQNNSGVCISFDRLFCLFECSVAMHTHT